MWHSEHKTEKHPNNTKLNRIQVHWNVFCKWKVQRDFHVCIMLLRTKPSQFLHLHSSHPSDPHHIPCYSFPTTVGPFGKNKNFSFCQSAVHGAASFSVLMCLQLWNVNDQIIKTATLIYLIPISHYERQHKRYFKIDIFTFSFPYKIHIFEWGLGKS